MVNKILKRFWLEKQNTPPYTYSSAVINLIFQLSYPSVASWKLE